MIKDIIIHCGEAEREPFGHTRRLEPQPWGAVTRRAVAQRRSRASGLTRLSAAAIRGFELGLCCRSAAVWCKAFVFSSLPIRKVLVLPFAGGVSPPLSVVSLLFSASYPQDRRSYYLWFYYLIFDYLSGGVFARSGGGVFARGKLPESQRSVDNPETSVARSLDCSPAPT